MRPRVVSVALDESIFGKIIEKGVESCILSDALLPALGILTGRRIALLATMRREDIVRVNDVWMVFPESKCFAKIK